MDSEDLEALAGAAREWVQRMQSMHSEASNPSDDLKAALQNFQQYVKYLGRIARKSDIMAGEIKAVENAAEAIKNLKGLSDSLDNLNQASRDLLKAVEILEKPREFRLVQDVRDKRDEPSD